MNNYISFEVLSNDNSVDDLISMNNKLNKLGIQINLENEQDFDNQSKLIISIDEN